MTSYPNRSTGSTRGGEDAARPPDPRLNAFADFVAATDTGDWRTGQLATRKLRALGISVCLIAPKGDRRGA